MLDRIKIFDIYLISFLFVYSRCILLPQYSSSKIKLQLLLWIYTINNLPTYSCEITVKCIKKISLLSSSNRSSFFFCLRYSLSVNLWNPIIFCQFLVSLDLQQKYSNRTSSSALILRLSTSWSRKHFDMHRITGEIKSLSTLIFVCFVFYHSFSTRVTSSGFRNKPDCVFLVLSI